ncbi:Type III secretion protein YscO [Variovorax sp. PBL-H6]|uniref:type III secretion system stalk subunit SctO n=1 Tax=Variovorax sp. PBL-H6 TaxID=434009 RepID=UPI00131748D7|nr:YscO family type III secretion system apparatus protein [Variovorax sp. PBL-H6]VTU22827.1 Type III secretion protein YscO [Variovorax sp. PBL-H6]
MDTIRGLLRIKSIREEGRERELRRARHDLEHAAQALREARQTHETRQQEHREREEAMYRDVLSRAIVVRELDDVHAEIISMKQIEQEDERAVEQAEEERKQRRDAMDAATAAWRTAAQACDKFRDLHHRAVAQQLEEEEQQAALELEEHPVRAGTRGFADLAGEL